MFLATCYLSTMQHTTYRIRGIRFQRYLSSFRYEKQRSSFFHFLRPLWVVSLYLKYKKNMLFLNSIALSWINRTKLTLHDNLNIRVL